MFKKKICSFFWIILLIIVSPSFTGCGGGSHGGDVSYRVGKVETTDLTDSNESSSEVFTYDASGNLIESIEGYKDGTFTKDIYEIVNGQLKTIKHIDKLNQVGGFLKYEYNTAGQVISTTYLDEDEKTENGYDSISYVNGKKSKRVVYYTENNTRDFNSTETYEYNGDKIKRIFEYSTENITDVTAYESFSELEYDSNGNLAKVSNKDKNGALTSYSIFIWVKGKSTVDLFSTWF